MRRCVLALLTVLAVAGCQPAPAPTSTGGTFEEKLTVDGRERTYRVHVPPSSLAGGSGGRTGRPVVVGLHGGGGNGAQFEQQSRLSPAADRAGFIAVYPDGDGRTRLLTWNAGTCCGYARDNGIDDVKFIAAMLDALVAKYHTDPAKVFVTGLSNGAMLTYRLACELADRITAIAPVAGAVNVDGCRPSRPIAALVIHGTADQVVPYDGGPPTRSIPGAGNWDNRSVQYAMTLLTTLDRCPATPSESREGAVVRTDYAPCADGLEVVLYTVEGGGHAWPGGEKPRDAADDPPPQPDASAVMLEFFARYSLDR